MLVYQRVCIYIYIGSNPIDGGFQFMGVRKKNIQTSSYWWSGKAMKIQGHIVLTLALPKPCSKSSSSWPCQSRGRVAIPSTRPGNLLHSYGWFTHWKYLKIVIYSWFIHWKWWFCIVFCMFTRGYHHRNLLLKGSVKKNLYSSTLWEKDISSSLNFALLTRWRIFHIQNTSKMGYSMDWFKGHFTGKAHI